MTIEKYPDFTEPLYGGVLLVLSNLVLVPAIILALYFRDLVTATILFLMFIVSTLYHICEANWYCMVSFFGHQTADHVMVYTLLFWVFIVGTTRYRNVQFSMLLINIASLVVFAVVTTQTFYFGILYVAFFIAWVIVSWAGFGMPPKPYDIGLIVIAVVLASSGFGLHLAGDDPGDSNYWWAHTLWHLFAMVAVIVLLVAIYGENMRAAWRGFQSRLKKSRQLTQPMYIRYQQGTSSGYLTTRDNLLVAPKRKGFS